MSSSAIPYRPPDKSVSKTQVSAARRDLDWSAASARLLFDRDDAILIIQFERLPTAGKDRCPPRLPAFCVAETLLWCPQSALFNQTLHCKLRLVHWKHTVNVHRAIMCLKCTSVRYPTLCFSTHSFCEFSCPGAMAWWWPISGPKLVIKSQIGLQSKCFVWLWLLIHICELATVRVTPSSQVSPTQLLHTSYLLTYLLTYSMERNSSCEANWFCSQSRNCPHFWNPKFHHRTHKCPPPVPILSQLHPVPTTPSHFLKIHLDIILPSTSGSLQWSLSLRFPHQNPVHPSLRPHTRHMPRPSHSSRFYHPHNIR